MANNMQIVNVILMDMFLTLYRILYWQYFGLKVNICKQITFNTQTVTIIPKLQWLIL